MSALLRAEFFKLRTTRAPWLLFCVAQVVIIAGVSGAFVAGADVHDPATASKVVAHVGLFALFTLILGMLAVAGEYRHGTITDTFLSTPRRERVILAKLVVYTAAGLLFGLSGAFTVLATIAIWLAAKGSALNLADAALWRTVLGGIGWDAGFAAIGVGLGGLLRNLTGAIAVALAWLVLVESIVGQLVSGLSRWLPFNAGMALDRGPMATNPLPQWEGGIALAGYAALFALLAVAFTVRRDVT